MARQPMPPGMFGNIHVKQLADAGGKPRWQARTRVRDQDGVTRQVSIVRDTKSKADRALREQLAKRSTPSAGGGALSASSRYEDVAARWLEQVKRDRARTTYDTYRRILHGTILPRFGSLRVGEVTGPRIDAALTDLHKRYTPNGIRQIKKTISGPLELARRLGLIDRNPTRDLDSVRGSGKRSRALTEDEEAKLLTFLDSDKRAKDAQIGDIVRFMLGTGCRVSEVLGARWSDVDLAKATFKVTGSLVRVRRDDDDADEPGLRRGEGKTEAAQRTLALPDDVVFMLRMREEPTWWGPESPLFASSTGNWRDLNNIQKLMRYVRGKVDGLDWVTTHTFRRTVATRMDAAGFSPLEIANQLGHARPSMSQDVYMARRNEGPARAAEALSRPQRLASRDA